MADPTHAAGLQGAAAPQRQVAPSAASACYRGLLTPDAPRILDGQFNIRRERKNIVVIKFHF
jgi:hypothetical protein